MSCQNSSEESKGSSLSYCSFSSSAVFSSSPGSNGNSSSWSSLGLEGDMYEENLSFPTSDRLVELRNVNQMGSS